MSDTPRAAPTAGSASAAAAAVNRFGFDLLRLNLGLAKGNVAVSAWSIATALGMVRLGAVGATAAEMDKVLHADASFADQMNALDQELASRNGKFPFGDQTLVVELAAANRAFAQSGFDFEQPFLDGLSEKFGSSLGLVDYRTATEAARREINGWVAERTRRRIKELLKEGVLDDSTVLTLVNAVYLKAEWEVAFMPSSTADAIFHAPDGDKTIPFMRGQETRRYATGAGWRGVELRYAGGKLAMTIVVPDAARFDAVAPTIDDASLRAFDADEAFASVDLSLPKFDIERATSLEKQLTDLGMPTAFSDVADFSGMARDEQLQLADVIHQANVTIDEKGTVAAAATAAVVRAVSSGPRPETLVVDRPFLFLIRDLPTGAVLFAGQVVNPATN